MSHFPLLLNEDVGLALLSHQLVRGCMLCLTENGAGGTELMLGNRFLIIRWVGELKTAYDSG